MVLLPVLLLLPAVVLCEPVALQTESDAEPLFIPMTKCYGQYGCFSTGGDFYIPRIRPLQFLPQDPKYIKVRYLLFTLKNADTKQELKFQDKASLDASHYDGSKKTVIITHGLLENGEKEWIRDMRKNFLLKGDFNVIQLDWGGGSKLPYTQATANIRIVGVEVALMIEFLEQNAGADRKNFHFLGHSLGSHLAGYCGERLGGKLGRITALDPAGPYFENTPPVVRLDPTDALFVDAIHTDGNSHLDAIKLDGGMGLMQTLGHVDFYPNGGQTQPSCSKNPILNIIINGIIEGTKWTVACHHLRVLPLMTDTILSENCRFKAFPCESYEKFKAGKCESCGAQGCASMGYYADQWKRGNQQQVKMFLDTKGAAPFCMHNFFLTIDIGDGDKARHTVNGNIYVVLHGEKSSSAELEFFHNTTKIAKNTSYGRYFGLHDLGVIKRVTFYWKYSKTITDPGGLIWSRYLHLKHVVVTSGTPEVESAFCGRQDALSSNSVKTIDVNDKC